MRRYLLLAAALFMPALALAQYSNQAPGQSPAGQGIDANTFAQNTTPYGFQTESLSAAVTATGTTYSNAALLVSRANIVTTVASGTGVRLPSVYQPTVITVRNRGANALLVYPPVGAQIEGGSVNAGVSVAAAGNATFLIASPTQVYQ